MKGGLFIPIEIVKREYTGKLLLACYVASHGVPVYIGHKRQILKMANSARESGVLFYKAADFFEKLKTKGFKIVAQDEEAGIVFEDFSWFANRRPSINNAGGLDRFYCWGSDDYKYLEENSSGKVLGLVKSGSPRTALWGGLGRKFFQNELEDIANHYKEYVLIASNLSAGNSYLGRKGLLRHLSQYPDWNEDRRSEFLALFDSEEVQMELFLEAAEELVKQFGVNVIIRPHPTENIQHWKDLVAENTNIFVVSDGDISPWILGAKCLVHNGCTSAIEAHVAGVPCIALGSSLESILDIPNSVPNQLSLKAVSVSELTEFYKNVDFLFTQLQASSRMLLERKLSSAGTMEPVKVISENLLEFYDGIDCEDFDLFGSDSVFYDLFDWVRSAAVGKLIFTKMSLQKRPVILIDTIVKDVERCLDLMGETSRLSVSRVGPSAFRLGRL